MHDVLAPHGVWYLAEVLPTEMAAHWAFTYFPEAWTWAQRQMPNLHTLYERLVAHGFKSEVKRQVWHQSVALGAALGLAQRREGLLAHLSDEAYQQGIERLQQAIAQRSAEHVVGSEIVLVEVWAQKE